MRKDSGEDTYIYGTIMLFLKNWKQETQKGQPK